MLRFGRNHAKPSVITLADRARDQGEWERAAGYYRDALRRNAQNPPIWVQYGHVLKESGHLAEAERAYRTAIAQDRRSADSHAQLGHVLKMQGKNAEARAIYLRAMASDPSLNGTSLEFAQIGWSEAYVSELRGMLGTAKTEPTRSPSGNGMARVSSADPRHRRAISANRSKPFYAKRGLPISRLRLNHVRSSRITLADRARDAGQWDAAARHYRQALDRNPRNPPIWVQYGHVLKESGKLAQAEEAYRTALGYDPSAADSHLQLGHVLKLQGKKSEAEAAYLRGFALDPSSQGVVIELARLGWDQARLSELRRIQSRNTAADNGAAGAGLDQDRAAAVLPASPLGDSRQSIAQSGLFDPEWYLAQNSDVAAAGIEPLTHYLATGSAEGRCPNPLFDPAWYRAQNPDVAAAGVEPLRHYLATGSAEGRRPSPLFDPSWYRAQHPGVAAAGKEPLAHYLSTDCANEQGLDEYVDWIRLYDTIGDHDRKAIAAAIGEMKATPLISVVMPVYETPEVYLRAAIDSVRRQLYPHWELCIADDASTAPHLRRVLEYYRGLDSRIKVCYRSKNGHISAATNSALSLAGGSFIALLDHDDELREHALYMVAALLDADSEVDLIYSDEDRIDANGRRYNPYFKSDWNPDLMLSQNMFCHLGVYRRSLIDRIDGFRRGYDGSQDYDLVLRAQSVTSPDRIRHIPHVLYHWRAIPGSVALNSDEAKPYALGRARAAIADCLALSGVAAEVLASPHPAFSRVRYTVPEPAPRVTIIVPARDRIDLLRKCVGELLHRTDYSDFEIVIVDNQSREPASHAYFDRLSGDPRIRVLSSDSPLSYAAINNFAVAHATGSLLCFLDNSTEAINRDWLTEMVSHALRPGIGAVGALLYFPDDRIKHAGLALGFGGVARHPHQGLRLGDRGDYGYFGRAAVVQNLSAVTAACLVMPKVVFAEIGGFNEKDAPVIYSDVDLCLRIREAGYWIVWTPHAELYHHASDSRGPDSGTDVDNAELVNAETSYMSRRWGHMLDRDPYYNPNLRLNGSGFGLASPPRIAWPWRAASGQRVPLASSSDARLVAASGLFNPAWYCAQNPDVLAAGLDPLEHYLATGSVEGRCPNPVFDPTWYRQQYPDVATAGIEPLLHYVGTGSAEGRRPSPLFDPVSYREKHPDVAAAGMEPLVHYLLTTSSAQRRSLAPGRLTDFPEMRIPDFFELRGMTPRGPIAVVLHLFYPELWDEMRTAIERISYPFDLFVSLVNGASDPMRRVIKQAFPYAYIFDFVEDRGRDMARFLALLETGVLFRYELVCKLHSKRSPFEPDGDGWRRALMDGVLGSSYQVDQIVSSFRSDPDLGMVVADGNVYSAYEHWSGNEKLLAELLPRIGISPDVKGRSFPGGGIFWIRPLLLRTLAGAGLNLGDFDPEPLPRDGALGHAVERMFGLICEDAGMRFVEWGQLKRMVLRPARRSSKVHIFAYYLPQFHPIRENDEWWGAGFTEWTNITRAKPLFAGHRQPRLPSELGFCDLRLPETREAQAALAREYGLTGFCYYYYWFNGRRILERPLDEVVASGKPDFPFLICWANEPWSRNWDGLNDEVLLPQTYEPGWAASFARDVAPLLCDRRYFRLDSKPMLLIYRIQHIPAAAAAMRELRAALFCEGISEVHLAAAWVQFPNDMELPADPAALGLDAYFEFPPHKVPAHLLRPRPADLPEECLQSLYDYNRTVTAALAKLDEPIKGRRHRCVMAAFDNTPRKADAAVFHGATPTNFRRWLRGTILHERRQKGERVVFVNAWNEWAEGTCLEPDRDFGRGWLEAVASATDLEWSKT